MKGVDNFYKTKALAKNGAFILLSVIVLLFIGGLLIPKFQVENIGEQMKTLNGFIPKHNDATEMSHFIQSIKKNNGVLCLGTSESTEMSGGNYYDFLNADSEIVDTRFSFLAGAGRTCGVYIPLFLHHRDELDSLKLTYYINPVYWGTNLCDVQKQYWKRYSNYKVITDLKLSNEDREAYFKPVQAYVDELNIYKKITFWNQQALRQARKYYFQDLRYVFDPKEYDKKLKYFPKKRKEFSDYLKFGEIDLEDIDTVWNIRKSFTTKGWFKDINEQVDYRYEELRCFVALCKDLGIKATFIVGPYNERFIQNYSQGSLKAYENTVTKVKTLLEAENADFIDASAIGSAPGSFRDHQHNSSYGAYLIYKEIKQHLYEKDTL